MKAHPFLRMHSWVAILLLACGAVLLRERPSRSSQERKGGLAPSQEPLDEIEKLLRTAKLAEAQAALRDAQQVYRSRGDQHGEAICYLLLGIAEARAMELSSATADIARGREMLDSLGDRFGAWIAEWMLGSLEAGAMRFEAGITHFERALALLHEAEGPRDRFGFRAFSYAQGLLGFSDDAVESLRSEHRADQPELVQLFEAMSRDGYVWILVMSERLTDAEAELSRLAEFSRRLGGRFDSIVEVHRGALRRKQGRLKEARESLRKALSGASSLPPAPFRDEWPELQVLEQLAEIDLQSGRCDEALGWSDEALERLRLRGAEQGRFSVFVRINRATALKTCGNLAGAEAVLSEALEIAREGGNAYLQAMTESELGQLLVDPGWRLEEAARHLETAVGLFQTVDASLAEAKAWVFLSECYANLEAHDAARVALERARKLARGSPFVAMVVEQVAASQRFRQHMASVDATGEDAQRLLGVLTSLQAGLAKEDPASSFLNLFIEGIVRFKRGEVVRARDLWTSALSQGAPTRELESHLLASIGVSYWVEGKIDHALPYFDRALGAYESVLDDVRVGELLTTFLGGRRQDFLQSLVEMLVLQGRPKEAFDYAERRVPGRSFGASATIGSGRMVVWRRRWSPKLNDSARRSWTGNVSPCPLAPRSGLGCWTSCGPPKKNTSRCSSACR